MQKSVLAQCCKVMLIRMAQSNAKWVEFGVLMYEFLLGQKVSTKRAQVFIVFCCICLLQVVSFCAKHMPSS